MTCTAQSDYLTGRYPDSARHRRQRLVLPRDCRGPVLAAVERAGAGAKIWDAARAHDPAFTCAKLFWWFNMYSTADYSVTPRPMYPADGRKMPDIYTQPATLRDELQAALGHVSAVRVLGAARVDPLDASGSRTPRRHVEQKLNPTLTLVYLPHLDYNLQRLGVDVAGDRRRPARRSTRVAAS